ncbi:uncharacterized protein LOC127703764 isoform X2 [Mytilus californianus]|uniref:uncharacterized protein LOC127703764 isoform X2 n=1 Tax=Mytilus californianus TaxID=6549 RepID=UPI002246B4AE|nr:uncharacterized protein LOC127703764 isoform X2 [Mytilus californianus]
MSSPGTSRKRQRDTSLSESTEDYEELPTKLISSATSAWKIQDLDQNSIFFAGDCLTVESLINLLKKRRSVPDVVPNIVKTLIDFTKECLNFTIDEDTWQMCDITVRPEQEKGIEILKDTKKNVRLFANKIRCEQSEYLDEEPLNRELFERWYCKVVDFLDQAVQLLNLLINEAFDDIENKKQTSPFHIKEASFTYLFMKFTEICFLTPEIGEGDKTNLWIRNKKVGSLPDVRYWQQSSIPNRNVLMMLAEVKSTALKTSEDTVESEEFSSTEDISTIIFYYLQLSNKHYRDLKGFEPGAVENMCSHIKYTQIFDIMKAEDRNQLLEVFFWLGCLQKRGLQSHYLVT